MATKIELVINETPGPLAMERLNEKLTNAILECDSTVSVSVDSAWGFSREGSVLGEALKTKLCQGALRAARAALEQVQYTGIPGGKETILLTLGKIDEALRALL